MRLYIVFQYIILVYIIYHTNFVILIYINLLFLYTLAPFKDALPCFSARAAKRVGAAPHKDDHTAGAPRPRGIMRHIPSAANEPRPNCWKMNEHFGKCVV